jgi:hypothetical protein
VLPILTNKNKTHKIMINGKSYSRGLKVSNLAGNGLFSTHPQAGVKTTELYTLINAQRNPILASPGIPT